LLLAKLQNSKKMRTCYFVTAKHVANDLKGCAVYFLVNVRGGGVVGISGVVGEHWFLYPTDDSADAAVVQVVMDGKDARLRNHRIA
jgi:hypothetical protein